jgi:FtsP/CotA-like multicopper oxidase with cupredoxin domain
MTSQVIASAKKIPSTRIAAAIAVQALIATYAHAGTGFVDSTDALGNPIRIQTYFAHSPSGARQGPVPVEATYPTMFPTGYPGTGKALRKFVDPLSPLGPYATSANTLSSNTAATKKIPVALLEKWINPNTQAAGSDDYLELAVVEYREQMHSDLPAITKTTNLPGPTGPATGGTVLRGYVQIASPQMEAAALAAGQTLAQAFKPLYYPDGSRIQVWDTNLDGSPKLDATGKRFKKDAWAVEDPHYLGPVITATQGTPLRVKFWNLLPVGRAQLDATGQVTQRNGDLFIPVDKSLAGAGIGADGLTMYSQNRVAVHLHGGDTPWISDGTAHQWFTPLGEEDASHTTGAGFSGNSLAAEILDPTLLPDFLRGPSASNVPDMYDPGPGAMTLYYTNGQSARMMWYHDHAVGITRLNAYSGMAAPFFLSDATEKSLIAANVIPGPANTLPLVLQDKCFVPKDIALQDARWNTTAWGDYGSFWFPHVYETVQDPTQFNSWNPVGRWHYGPWFWPVFPALYALPTGAYGDETTTPESWCDTPVVNGVAYPFVEVEPKPYRLRILNGANDRFFTFNLFQADPSGAVIDAAGNVGSSVDAAGNRTWVDASGTPMASPINPTLFPTDVRMTPAQPATNPCPAGKTRSDQVSGGCTPANWPTDGRPGGVPDPATAGPTLYMIGNEAGFLAKVFPIEPLPTNPLYDVGRITVLNINTTGLFLGNAERADVVVDFSQYAGQTLIAYNDMHAPVPAADPRNAYFTGVGDQTASGGAEDTLPGYGPNTRTLMQIRVRPLPSGTTATPYNPAPLNAEIPKAYAASQERPVVAQSAYNQAFGTSWNDTQAFASIFTGSLKQPQFVFTLGNPGVFDQIKVNVMGSGYVTAPTVVFTGGLSGLPSDVPATANASLKMDQIAVTNAGSGYLITPAVKIATTTGGGSGATARTTLKVSGIKITNGGTGYTTAPLVTFSKPQEVGGIPATGTAVIKAGKVTGITLTNGGGTGYWAAPTITIAPPTVGTKALATSSGSVERFILTSPDPTNPAAAGGGGYTDFTGVTITLTAAPTGGVTATGSATGKVFDVTLVHPGNGYTAVPQVSFSGGKGTPSVTATATALSTGQGSYLVKSKAIQELFEPTFGRLNATLGIELPFTSALTQTTIPLLYIDPPTEIINDFETQIWKITHNGVDTHPVHFHLMNVQVINRVGWDGFISPPDPSEVGWKETVKMNPLEDIIVALKPKHPTMPGFGLPLSVRPMDPSQPLGSPFGFTQVDINTGLPAQVVNTMTNFGWEYVWHCHILGHEENDFMRPLVFQVSEAVPSAPTGLTANTALAGGMQLAWTDNARTEYKQIVDSGNGTTWAPLVTLPANLTSYRDPTPLLADTLRSYRITAVGASGTATSTAASVAMPNTPTLTGVAQTAGTASVKLTFTDSSKIEKTWSVQQSVAGGAWTDVGSVASTTSATTGTGKTITVTATSGGSVSYRMAANAMAVAALPSPNTASAWSNALAVTITKVNQTLTTPASVALGNTGTVTASSGLPVTLTATSTPTICSVAGSVITPIAAGTCTVTGTQAGNTLWNTVTATKSVTISKKAQTIALTFTPTTMATRTSAITVAASATSGLPVTLTVTTTNICTLTGTTVTGKAKGNCTVSGTQAGDATWNTSTATQTVAVP